MLSCNAGRARSAAVFLRHYVGGDVSAYPPYRWLGRDAVSNMPYIRMMLGNVPPQCLAAFDVLSEAIRSCAEAEALAGQIAAAALAVPPELQELASIILASANCSFREKLQMPVSRLVSSTQISSTSFQLHSQSHANHCVKQASPAR